MSNRQLESGDSLVKYEVSKELGEEGFSPGPISVKDSGKRSHGFDIVGLGDSDHILEVVAIRLFIRSSSVGVVVIRRFSSTSSASCLSWSDTSSEGINDSSTDLPFRGSTESKLVSSERNGSSILSGSIRWLGQFVSDLVLRGVLCEGSCNSFYGHQ